MSESSQKFVGRNRPPRVHISYDVEIGNATVKKELPFIMGVMADLSGDRDPDNPLADVVDRKFTEVDANTFATFMKDQNARVAFEVENTLDDKGGKLKVDHKVTSLADFSPAAVAKKTEGLKELYEARQELDSLLTKVGAKPKLEKVLQNLMGNQELLKKAQETHNPSQP